MSRQKKPKTEITPSVKKPKKKVKHLLLRHIAPLILAAIAGGTIVWFNINPKKESPKTETKQVQKIDNKVSQQNSLENIISQSDLPNIDKAREYNSLGLQYFARKRYDEAEDAFEKALKICPNYEIAIGNLFNIKFVLDKYGEAISLLSRLQDARAMGHRNDLRKCYLAYSAHLLHKKNTTQSQKNIEEFFKLRPVDAEFGDGINLYLKIAGSYFVAENFRDCILVSKRMLELIPEEYKSVRAKVHSNLGLSYVYLAEQKEAGIYLKYGEEHMSKAKELDPDNAKIKEMTEKYGRVIEANKNKAISNK